MVGQLDLQTIGFLELGIRHTSENKMERKLTELALVQWRKSLNKNTYFALQILQAIYERCQNAVSL